MPTSEIAMSDKPVFTPAEALAATGLTEPRLLMWVQRGFFPRAARTGSGVRRQYSLSDLMNLAYLRVASDAGIPLADAAINALYLFPALKELAPAVITDVLQSTDRPDLAPEVYAIFHEGKAPLVVTKGQIDEARTPIHEGAGWATIIDISKIVVSTVRAAEQILARRGTAGTESPHARPAILRRARHPKVYKSPALVGDRLQRGNAI